MNNGDDNASAEEIKIVAVSVVITFTDRLEKILKSN
jgi:hypothetical protein